MIRTAALALSTLALIPIGVRAACDGAHPAITSVTLRGLTKTRYLDLYHVSATVTNLGNEPQGGDVLQFVDVNQYGRRLDDRGIPPLEPGQSYTIAYVWPRSVEAGKLTSPLYFRIRSAAQAEACTPARGDGITI